MNINFLSFFLVYDISDCQNIEAFTDVTQKGKFNKNKLKSLKLYENYLKYQSIWLLLIFAKTTFRKWKDLDIEKEISQTK